MSLKCLLCVVGALTMTSVTSGGDADTARAANDVVKTAAADDLNAAEPSLYSTAYLAPKTVAAGPPYNPYEGAVGSTSTNVVRSPGQVSAAFQKTVETPFSSAHHRSYYTQDAPPYPAGPYPYPAGPYQYPAGPYPYPAGPYPYPAGPYPYPAATGAIGQQYPYPYVPAAATGPYPYVPAAAVGGPYPNAAAPIKPYGYGPAPVGPPQAYAAPVVTPPHSVAHTSFTGPYGGAHYSYKR